MASIAAPLRLKKGQEQLIRDGYPWIYSSDMIESSELLLLPAGSLVAIETHKGERLGVGYYNAKSPIACRVLALGTAMIDETFFATRLAHALARRAPIGIPYYRLVHSEADFLPGLLVDRFGDILVVQVGTAGMEQLKPLWLAALDQLLAPKAIVLRNDTSARTVEGLSQEARIEKGEVPALVEVIENGCVFFADLMKGQKTGWFYDQRDNHALMAARASGKTMLDVYAHAGGFGIQAALAGATQVEMVDSSALALSLAEKAAVRNGVAARCNYRQGDAFALMQSLQQEGKHYDMVCVDPPAFVKQKKDLASGLKGYEKATRLAAPLVAPGGLLFVASCSHHATRPKFNQAVLSGVKKAGYSAKIIQQTGASLDHPRHPKLAQSEYLKGIVLEIAPAATL
ncbi:MAG: class I SAM-dependent rRNA methyltransferase [Rickettsiales bacterium]|nr:class I SAM-dependent rRNA methyltransferase [Rickettsiales bacterium]